MITTFRILLLVAAISATAAFTTSLSDEFSGTWEYTVSNTPNGDYKGKMILSKEGDTHTGYMAVGENRTEMRNISVEEGKLKFNIYAEGYDCKFVLMLEDGQLKGTVSVETEAFPVVATKAE